MLSKKKSKIEVITLAILLIITSFVGISIATVPIDDTPCDETINLVENGGFEQPIVTHTKQWDIFSDGTAGLEWQVEWVESNECQTDNLEIHRGINDWQPAEGDQYAEIDSDFDGPDGSINNEPASITIYQDIITCPERHYNLSFSFSPRPGRDETDNILTIKWDETTVDTISADGIGNSNTEWTTYTYELIASSTLTRLSFTDDGIPNSFGVFIDDVSLRSICNPSDDEPTDEWDKSSLEVTGICEPPYAVFTITNTGDPGEGDMDEQRDYRILRNGELEQTGQFQLIGGADIEIQILSECDIIKLEADQDPLHPGNSHPNAIIEECDCDQDDDSDDEPCEPTIDLPEGTIIMYAWEEPNNWSTMFKNELTDIFGEYDVANGTYHAWCVDYGTAISQGYSNPHVVSLYNSYQPPEHLLNENWHKINYLLNHKQGDRYDVQRTLWYFVNFGPWNWNYTGYMNEPVTQNVYDMIDDANENSADWCPGCGDIIAVICDSGIEHGFQITIIEAILCEENLLDDTDDDGIPDIEDNCPDTYNPDQVDADSDGIGDVCDTDIDGDGYSNDEDCNPTNPNSWRVDYYYYDGDSDGYYGDGPNRRDDGMMAICYGSEIPQGYTSTTLGLDCDDYDANIHPGAMELCDNIDNDCDGIIDEGCEAPDEDDTDDDGIEDEEDNCPETYNPDQTDTDGDGMGDACDDDDDGDGILDEFESDGDTDDDGIPDQQDDDDDDDGTPTDDENSDPNEDGNPEDADDLDGDGIPDYLDPYDDTVRKPRHTTSGNGNRKPIAITNGPYESNVGDTITFDASQSYDPDGDEIVNYQWDFGNGYKVSGMIVNYSYTKPYDYYMTLTVTDIHGASHETATTAKIIQPNRPPSEPNIGSIFNAMTYEKVSFSAQSIDPDDNLITYTFDWGDGYLPETTLWVPSGMVSTMIHDWNRTGTYTLTVTASDGELSTASSVEIIIKDTNLAAIVGYSIVGLVLIALTGVYIYLHVKRKRSLVSKI
ncbi:MAG: PKD domain-containing protein [Thermoplasmatota archaeon]